jgi:HlyD family secretion protein
MKIWILFLFLVAAGGGWWYLHQKDNGDSQYITAPVARGDITESVTATGTLNPLVNVTVGSQISGNIQKLYADFNSPVKAGQIVAQLDPSMYQAIVHQGDGNVANAEAALELAQVTAKRKQELVNEKAAPQADLDNALASLHQAEANLTIQKANLEQAQVNLYNCTIYSPIDGIVISRNVDVGQTVAAAMNAPVLFTIAKDLTQMQIDSAVAEADVGTATVGQDVDFTVDAFPYETFHGKVAQVRNAASTVQNVVTYDVVIGVHNPDLKLKPGMTATLSIIVAHKENTLKIPNAALRFHMADGRVTPTPPPMTPLPTGKMPHSAIRTKRRERNVYVVPPDGGKPAAVPIKLGISDGISTEVLEGLKENDVVVIGMEEPVDGKGRPPANPFGPAHR